MSGTNGLQQIVGIHCPRDMVTRRVSCAPAAQGPVTLLLAPCMGYVVEVVSRRWIARSWWGPLVAFIGVSLRPF